MATAKKDDLLRKIAALLAKAESTEHEGERQVFMQKADELMMKYSIELWELANANAGKVGARQPIAKDFDYKWAFDSGPFPEICNALWSIFVSCAGHANCKIVYHKQHWSGETKMYKGYTVPVVGTEVDLGYLAQLFTSLMTQLIDATHPKWDHSIGYEPNLAKFREAGWGWLEVAKVAQDAGVDTGMSISDARHKQAHAYRRWCKRTGHPQDYANFKTYRRNFADGFASRVHGRMSEARQTTAEHVGNGMEIALRDQAKINLDFINEMFPPDGRTRTGSLTKDNRKFDSSAYTGGRAAGDRANISANPSKGVSGRKGISK